MIQATTWSGRMRLACAVLFLMGLLPAAGAAATIAPVTATVPVGEEEEAPGAWQQARALADAARYDSALAVLRAALATTDDEFGLRWLEAGITGEAGRHAEAVRLYERLSADHPDRARELLADLAAERLDAGDAIGAARDYRAWLALHPDDADAARGRAQALAGADSLRAALAAYDALLSSDPDDTEAALGRARMLSWMGRHGAAARAYRAVLDEHPDEPDAVLGLATNQNWNGRHRAASRRLETVAYRPDADPEGLKALAFARSWDEDPAGARAALDDYLRRVPDDAEALGLSRRLRREEPGSVRFEFGRADDSDDLSIVSPGVTLSLPLSRSTAALLGWRDERLEDDGGRRTVRRFSAGLRQSFAPAWFLYGDVARTHWGADAPGTLVSGDVGVIHRPTDGLRLEAAVEREPVFTRRSVELGISLLEWVGAVDASPVARLPLHADGRLGRFSDGNRSERLSASAGWKALSRPRGEATLLVSTTQLNVRFDPDHGYYAPDFHREWGPGVDAEWRPSEDQSYGFIGQVGWQRDKGDETQSFYTLVGRTEFGIGERWTLDLEAGHSNSNLRNASGYERTHGLAGLTLAF